MKIKLNRDSWHYKLQTWIFGEPDFQNFCPYFWLTIFCMLWSPVFGSFRLLRWVGIGLIALPKAIGTALKPAWDWFDALMTAFFKALDETICQPLDQLMIYHLSDAQLERMYDHSRYRYASKEQPEVDILKIFRSNVNDMYWGDPSGLKKRMRTDAKFQVWKDQQGDDWRKNLDEAISRIEERHAAENKREREMKAAKKIAAGKAKIARQKRLNQIASFTKALVPWLIGAAGLVGLYILFNLLVALWAIQWALIFKAIWAAIVFVAVWVAAVLWVIIKVSPLIAITVGAVFLFVKLVRKCDLTAPEPSAWMRKELDFSFLTRPFVWFFGGIRDGFLFLKEGFLMFKKDYCPQIEWTD